jgi:hypothetical protein
MDFHVLNPLKYEEVEFGIPSIYMCVCMSACMDVLLANAKAVERILFILGI